jgi:arylsulfatase A-like enzyme
VALASAGIYTRPIEPAGDRKKPKHLVVLLVDTLRADKLSPFDASTRVRSPVIDKIASEGTTFLQAQSPAPWTKPSVASILTGLQPMTHGAKTQAAVVPASAIFLGEHLKGQGWATAGFIGNGYVSDKFGFDQGWDRYRNFIREGGDTDASSIFREAGDWAEAHKDEPFFLYVHTIDPHVPYDPPEEFLRLYDDRPDYAGQVRARSTGDLLAKAKKSPPQVTFDASDRKRLEALHDGEITQHDVELGKFVDRLYRLGIWQDTLFVFVSDHGEEFDDHGSWGHGHSVYQELLHVPLVMRYAGGVPAGRRVASAVGTVDIAPTVLELMGMPPLPDAEGRSLVPLLADDHPPGVVNAGMSEWGEERRVLTTSAWKLILRGNLTTAMFDLASDPGETQQKDVGDFPIAARFTRILQGQYLGATDRRNWMSAEQGASRRLDTGEADMDPATCEQLKALGYVDAETDCSRM